MIQLAGQLVSAYRMYLGGRGVKSELLSGYLKWLRLFFDFCQKYNIEGVESARLRRFIDKLKSKGQNNNDLHSLCSGNDGKGTEKSTGFLRSSSGLRCSYFVRLIH